VKAIVYHRYGRPLDVLRVEEVEQPVPGPGEALIRVRAAAANALDIHFMRGKPRIARLMMGLRHPKLNRPGADVAGVVEAVGEGCTLKPGDAVFGICRGAFAEYACIKEDKLAPKPPTLSFEEAASLPVAGLTALQGLRDKGRLGRGETVLVNGAGGGIGIFAIQIARALGAEAVTAVCSRGKGNLVRSLGADRVLDYAEEDFTAGPERYDMIFDVASPHGFARNRRALRPGGRVVAAGMTAGGGEPSLRWMLRHIGRLVWGWAYRNSPGRSSSRSSPRATARTSRRSPIGRRTAGSARSSMSATGWSRSPRRSPTSPPAMRPGRSSSASLADQAGASRRALRPPRRRRTSQ
jgi:NADPH:quinone reductase-like Zn-dependent oxidoreductase